MKYFIALLFIATQVMAEEPPPFLKDAKIVVTLKDGKEYTFSANQWKVVPRLDKAKAVAPTLVSEQKNRVRVLGGVGPQGFSVSKSPSEVIVKDKKEAVVGLGYERKITKRFSLGGEVISNGTYLFDFGIDF